MGRHSKPTKWTPEMVVQLHDLCERGMTDPEIASLLDIPINSVVHKRHKLGIVKGMVEFPPCPRPKDKCTSMDKALRCTLLSDTRFDRPCPFCKKEV